MKPLIIGKEKMLTINKKDWVAGALVDKESISVKGSIFPASEKDVFTDERGLTQTADFRFHTNDTSVITIKGALATIGTQQYSVLGARRYEDAEYVKYFLKEVEI